MSKDTLKKETIAYAVYCDDEIMDDEKELDEFIKNKRLNAPNKDK